MCAAPVKLLLSGLVSVAELRPALFVPESRYLLSEIAAAGAPAAA
jgi:hypothetical protein